MVALYDSYLYPFVVLFSIPSPWLVLSLPCFNYESLSIFSFLVNHALLDSWVKMQFSLSIEPMPEAYWNEYFRCSIEAGNAGDKTHCNDYSFYDYRYVSYRNYLPAPV